MLNFSIMLCFCTGKSLLIDLLPAYVFITSSLLLLATEFLSTMAFLSESLVIFILHKLQQKSRLYQEIYEHPVSSLGPVAELLGTMMCAYTSTLTEKNLLTATDNSKHLIQKSVVL